MKKKLFFILLVLSLFVPGLLLAQEDSSESIKVSKPQSPNKLSLDIKGMDIIDVLKMLATRSNINIVVGKNVIGKVTLFLKDVDIQDAFEIIILANDLAYEKKGDIINVMTQRDYELLYGERYQDKREAKGFHLKYAKAASLSLALNQMKTNLGKIVTDEASNTLVLIDTPEKIKEMEDFIKNTDLPIQTRVFGLNYAQADKLQAKIAEAITKGVGSIKTDERTNKIAITDYPEKLDDIANIINDFDEKTPQVLIDAQVIEIRPSDKFEMGVDWDFWIKNNFRVTGALPIGSTNRLLIGTTSTAPGGPGEYKAIFDILRTIGDTKILSSPRIMALNNQEAKILVGTKDAYITSSTSQTGETAITSQSVNFVDVGIKLYVTPTVSRDGFVTMKIRPEISSAERTNITSQGQVTQVPIVTTSEAETAVIVKDGVTIIIGGLKKEEKSKTVKKIPLISDIPLLGLLFRNISNELKKTELVILLTPHIMSGESPYTDFAEIQPKEGAVAKMYKGNIITEKISAPAQILTAPLKKESSALLAQEKIFNYYQTLIEKIERFAKLDSPADEQGEVSLFFVVSSKGALIKEPEVTEATNFSLVPFAIKAVKEAAPFAVFPKDLKKTEEAFNISVTYE